MEFEARKLAALNSLASPLPDKSRKGGVDALIAPLIAQINAHPAFFTTSSCSGRISISMSSPLPEQQQGEDQAEDLTNKTKKKKKGEDWSYVTHSEADAEEIVRTVVQSCGHNMEEAGQQQHGLMVFRFEPFILAVECRDLVAAQALVSCAISSGFRESGITSIRKRIIAAVRCSLRIEAPIAEDGRVLVSEDYLRFLVGIANVKMLNNHQRTQKFLSSFIDQVASPSHDEGIESTSQDIRRQSHESLKEKHFPHECKGKPRKFNIKERKLSELEKRQVGLLCRLDEVEARLCDLVPKYGGGVDHDASSAIGGALDQKPMGNRNIQGIDALAQLNVLFKDDLADSEVERVSAQECEQRIEKDLHDLCEQGRSRGVAFSSLSVPSEKLYRWGHSTCFLRCVPGMPSRSLLVFGGYGGSVRQCRQNDLVLLTIDDGKVQSICADNPPTARMGHTASLVGKKMVVIGGREDPSKPLGDVCVLLLDKVQWVYPQVRGAFFPPRHRHGAVTVGEKIYVFGGLDNVNVLGDLFILDTSLMQWSQAECAARVPAPRYSHSLSVIDQKIYLFGGFDGRTVYGDLWVFNLVKLTWSTVKLISIPRFSHSMTISSGFLILLGGCPLTKHENAVSLLYVDRMEWVHAKTDLPSECLFVRHTATCIGDQIVIIGGGVSCYAFGIKFSPPFLMGLASLSRHLAVKDGKKGSAIDHLEDEVMSMNDAWGLKIDKVHAKICKDNLKQLGWLDTKRKAKVGDDGLHIIFPITIEGVCELKAADAGHAQELLQGYGNAEFARSLIDFEILQLKQHTELKVSKQPLQVLRSAIFSLLQKCGMPPSLLHELPKRWERLDDMVVLPANSFTSEIWSSLGQALWTTVAKSLNVHRVARQARVKASSTRDSNLLLLFGCNGWVHHRESGILYCFDATKCMFSSGNISEKLRMAKLDCTGETIVDLFAGIGYFVLPFLLKANAKRVYACEWNPPALDALRYNLHANAVEDRCTVLEGDNRITAPHGVADRVCLGLLPTSEHCWDLAVKALRPAGGMLHIHGNVKDTEEQQWVDHVCLSIRSLSENDGLQWDVHATHVERVKWYAPHIRHLVVDVKCNWKDDSEFSMQSF